MTPLTCPHSLAIAPNKGERGRDRQGEGGREGARVRESERERERAWHPATDAGKYPRKPARAFRVSTL